MIKILKIVGIIAVGVFLSLALVGYLSGSDLEESAPPIKSATTEKPSIADLKGQLKQSNLTLCEVYQWIGEMESQTRKEIEKADPKESLSRNELLEETRQYRWKAYCEKHHINPAIEPYVNGYGLEECK